MYKESDKYKEYLVTYSNFVSLVSGKMCKGVDPKPDVPEEELDHGPNPVSFGPSPYSLIEAIKDILAIHIATFAAVGKTVEFPDCDHRKDTSDDFAKKMVDSGNWEQIVPEFGEDFYPLLQDHDILTWAYSVDGTEACNEFPGMDGGNTTTGFLIKASDDYPTLAYAICVTIPSGVFPLSEVLTNQERHGNSLKARLIYIHRWVGTVQEDDKNKEHKPHQHSHEHE